MRPVFLTTAALGAIWAVTTACWYLLFVWTVDRGRHIVSRHGVHCWLNGASGLVLLALGVGVIVS